MTFRVCIIDDDELFEMWLTVEADRIARLFLTFSAQVDRSLPKVTFETSPTATAVLEAISGNEYVDPLYIPHNLANESIDRIRRTVEERQLANCCQMRDVEQTRPPICPVFAEPLIKEEPWSPASDPEIALKSPSPPPSPPSAAKRLPSKVPVADFTAFPLESSDTRESKSETAPLALATSFGAWPPRRACTVTSIFFFLAHLRRIVTLHRLLLKFPVHIPRLFLPQSHLDDNPLALVQAATLSSLLLQGRKSSVARRRRLVKILTRHIRISAVILTDLVVRVTSAESKNRLISVPSSLNGSANNVSSLIISASCPVIPVTAGTVSQE